MSENEYPLKTTFDISGTLTETLWFPADKQVKKSSGNNLIFFMIPGNPGVIDYYTNFLMTIYEEHDKLIDVIGEKFEKEQNVKPKFILAGHSVGGHICKEILKARPNHGIERVYALFPTLQHILKTPNGAVLNPLLFGEFQRNISASFVQLIRTNLFPSVFKLLIKLCTAQSDPYLSVTTDKLLHGHIVKNALYMASSEMESITELEEEFYRSNLNKFVFYFSNGDRWAPLSHYEDMVQRFPEGKILLCDQGMPHSFVLGEQFIISN
ncbi:7735_t:CDS:2 [Racocetra fulgida]|uniref:7735_t:CDS:1 n=1 Tax=Racocetra fulgida TaxID=60492 RepID=A0A9N9F4I6_9GLOM|nr:7735_t:CDS:2 [Racocetra fulgida]